MYGGNYTCSPEEEEVEEEMKETCAGECLPDAIGARAFSPQFNCQAMVLISGDPRARQWQWR